MPFVASSMVFLDLASFDRLMSALPVIRISAFALPEEIRFHYTQPHLK